MEHGKGILEDMVTKCRFCNNEISHIFVDLGMSPLANSYLKTDDLTKMEPYYPLRAHVCSKCFLVQLEEFETPTNIFSDYLYFSSFSQTWLKHVQEYANSVIDRFRLKENSKVIEIASNDGYLLQHFKSKNISVLGIEPAGNVAKAAKEKGIPTKVEFFSSETAKKISSQEGGADLLIAVNVLPHVPNLNDFVKGLKILLKPTGVLTIQFSAYMLPLIQQNEFDMIYHEHFSYFSFYTLRQILSYHGLTTFDVEELDIHGGSLRVYVKHDENNTIPVSDKIEKLIEKEKASGILQMSTYTEFFNKVKSSKISSWEFFMKIVKERKKVVGYGAPAKGNTLLNYYGIGRDFIEYTVDISPYKQGLYLPGSHIPIMNPDRIKETKPDYLLILAWNLKEEVMEQMSYIRKWGGKFVIPIPRFMIMP